MKQEQIAQCAIRNPAQSRVLESDARVTRKSMYFPPSVIAPLPQALVGWKWIRE
jgi:hypothetical protein